MMNHVYNVFHAFPAPTPEIVITSYSGKRGNTFTFIGSNLYVSKSANGAHALKNH